MGKLEAAIEVKDLSFAYEGRPILDQVSLEIPEGQFTVLLGKNGSGKSTLMRILAGLLDFERGEVQIMGEEIRSFSSRGRGPGSSATCPSTTVRFSPFRWRKWFSPAAPAT